MAEPCFDVVTSSFSYTGKYITACLLAEADPSRRLPEDRSRPIRLNCRTGASLLL